MVSLTFSLTYYVAFSDKYCLIVRDSDSAGKRQGFFPEAIHVELYKAGPGERVRERLYEMVAVKKALP